MDCSPPGSSFHGIFQARALEWGAIAFSVYCGIFFFFFCVKLSKIYNRSTSSGFFFSPGIKNQQYLRGEDLEQEEAGPQAASGGGAGVEKGRLKVLPAPEAVALLLLS